MKKLVLAVFLTCAFSSNLFADLLGDSVNVFFDTPGPGTVFSGTTTVSPGAEFSTGPGFFSTQLGKDLSEFNP